jgi:hypothetical protein
MVLRLGRNSRGRDLLPVDGDTGPIKHLNHG